MKLQNQVLIFLLCNNDELLWIAIPEEILANFSKVAIGLHIKNLGGVTGLFDSMWSCINEDEEGRKQIVNLNIRL
jgi:hypothetical protein